MKDSGSKDKCHKFMTKTLLSVCQSLNLKPTKSCVKPNLKGPPTNLKIAAILERANAIRQVDPFIKCRILIEVMFPFICNLAHPELYLKYVC